MQVLFANVDIFFLALNVYYKIIRKYKILFGLPFRIASDLCVFSANPPDHFSLPAFARRCVA